MRLPTTGTCPLGLVAERGDGPTARVFTFETADGHWIECAETEASEGPGGHRRVLSVSTLLGCPVRCAFCDAGGHYEGRLEAVELRAQVDWLLGRVREGDPSPSPAPSEVELQLTRMGEPAFNRAVLELLSELPERHPLPGLSVLLSTVMPACTEPFFESLLDIARRYPPGRLQLQLSLQTTDEAFRRRLVPVRSWSFAQAAAYGARFRAASGGQVTLAFAAAEGLPLEPAALVPLFPPESFRIRLSALHPTAATARIGLRGRTAVGDAEGLAKIADGFRAAGYQVAVAPGSAAEVEAGAACGQYLSGRRERLAPRRTRAARAGGRDASTPGAPQMTSIK
ncbi:MAG: radical SAM protein [Myxococcales bacterium]